MGAAMVCVGLAGLAALQQSGGGPDEGLPSAPATQQQATAEADARTGANDTAGDDIVVTAQRRSERLLDVPISITALSSDQLTQRGVRSTRDLQFAVPNLTLYSRTEENPDFIIRGISTGARNIGFETGLGVYVDGVLQGRTSAATQELDDIERVEVLRGPQGTLFGKNTTAGALNLTTFRPGDTLSGRVLAEYGNYDYQRLSGFVAGPLVPGLLYAKVSGFGTRRDGYASNVDPNGPSRIDDDKSYGGRGEVRLTPAAGLDIALRGDFSSLRRLNYDSEVSAIIDNPFGIALVNPITGPRTLAAASRYPERRRIGGGSLTATYDFGGYQLTSISALRYLSYGYRDSDLDAEPADYLRLTDRERLRQFTQEVRLSSPAGDRFSYVVGAFYFNQRSTSDKRYEIGNDLKSIYDATLGIPPSDLPDVATSGRVYSRSWAVFGNATFKLTDRLELNAGLRYNDERKTLRVRQVGDGILGLPDVAPLEDRQKDRDWTPTAGINFHPNRSTLLYVRYARGTKSGGWNAELLSSAVASDFSFRGESIDNYEIGLKTQLFNRRLSVNAAAYNLIYKGIQVARYDDVTGLSRTTNAAKARSRGFELEIDARPLRGLELGAAVGYADARYLSYTDAAPGVDLSGARLDAPRWTGSATAAYSVNLSSALEATLRGDYAFRSRSGGDGLDPYSSVPGFGTLNLRFSIASKAGWEMAAYARNVTKRNYLLERYSGGNLANTLGVVEVLDSYGPPRTYGLAFSHKF